MGLTGRAWAWAQLVLSGCVNAVAYCVYAATDGISVRDRIVCFRSIGERDGPRISTKNRTTVGYPEPDVAVVPVAITSDRRYADRFFLVAEVVSQSDEAKIEGKREVYKHHPDCECVLVIRQDRFEVMVDLRAGEVWARQTLSAPDEQMSLPAYGLQCSLKDLYKGTIGPREPV
jgi:Uma2 family endonuclease